MSANTHWDAHMASKSIRRLIYRPNFELPDVLVRRTLMVFNRGTIEAYMGPLDASGIVRYMSM